MWNYLDPQTGEHIWRCPQCKASIRFHSELAVTQAEKAGGCHGCRARATFRKNPGLVGFFVDFWARADAWPQSNSWLEAIPAAGISIADHGFPGAGQSIQVALTTSQASRRH